MRELAVVVSDENTNLSTQEAIDAIAKAGFKNVFIQWYNDNLEFGQEKQLEYIKELGLNVIFAHLGYQTINSLWGNNSLGDDLVERYKNDINICKNNGINMVIIHLSSGSSVTAFNKLGLDRIQKIADFAKDLNVRVAFENNKLKGYLEYVIDNIKNDNVGICYDSGHCHAYFNDEFDYLKFKNRIFAVHLHDNDKTGDLHLTPFDGTTDWEAVVCKLKDAGYDGPITLESIYGPSYLKMSPTDFFEKNYQVGLEIDKLFI